MYIYNQLEVIKTGRLANRLSRDKTRVIDTLFEIKPADPESGGWTKWVRETDLYVIHDPKDGDQ